MSARDVPPGDYPPGYYPGPRPAPPEPSRLSYVISGLVAAALFAAIVGGDLLLTGHHHTTAGPTTTSSIPAPAPPTPTTSTTTSTSFAGGIGAGAADIPAASATPPSLAAAYTADPVVVVKTLSTYIDWVYAHPDPALVANFMLTSNPNYAYQMNQLQLLVNRGWHERPSVTQIVVAKANAPFQPFSLKIDGHQAYGGTTVRVVIQYTPQSSDLLNAAGQVVGSSHNPIVPGHLGGTRARREVPYS